MPAIRRARARSECHDQPTWMGTQMAKGDKKRKKSFLTDVQTLRKRARAHIERGAVTDGYSADRGTVLKLLNEALATEIICVLRYRRHHFMASGLQATSVA